MPVNKNALIRYQALDKCFSNWGRKYFIEDLVEACNQALYEYTGNTEGVKKRQVYDDIRFMESEQGYSIPLERLREGKRVYYRYADRNFSINNKIIDESEVNQLKEALSVLKKFKGLPQFEWIEEILMRLESLSYTGYPENSVVEFEQNPYLKGLEFFNELFQAIIYKKVLRITYKSYKDKKAKELKIHPYFLKQYNNRWFLFGFNPELNKITTLALDRIKKIKETKDSYIINKTIDFDEYFYDVVGVSVLDTEPLEVILKVKYPRYLYIESKPIHGSQILVKKNKQWAIFKYKLQINNELVSLIFSFSDDMVVMQPVELRDKIIDKAEKMIENYKKKSF